MANLRRASATPTVSGTESKPLNPNRTHFPMQKSLHTPSGHDIKRYIMKLTLTVVVIVGAFLAVTLTARLVGHTQSLPQISAPKPLPSPIIMAEELRAVPSIAGEGKNLIIIWSYELS